MSAAPVAEASAAPADNGEPVQLQFEEEVEQGLGPDAAVPDPPSSPWVRRKKRQTAVPEQAKASDALAAKGTGGPGTCLLCQKKCYNKSKFCNELLRAPGRLHSSTSNAIPPSSSAKCWWSISPNVLPRDPVSSAIALIGSSSRRSCIPARKSARAARIDPCATSSG